jgi:hypothetical protein
MTNASSLSRLIAPKSWKECGPISSGQTPPITRPAAASSTKGIRSHGGRAPVRAARDGTSWFPLQAAARTGARVPSAP